MAEERVSWWRRRRYWLAALLFLGYAIFKILQANLSIIIVCMVKHGRQNSSHVTVYNATGLSSFANETFVSVDEINSCPRDATTDTAGDEDGEFEWDKQFQGILLGGYFWGYASGSQIVGGWLSQRYGARKIISLGLLPMAIGTILSPVAVRVSPYLFLAIRVITGISTGVMFPSAPVFWSRWSPPNEWSRLLSSSNAGGACFLWCIVWILLSRDSPSHMPGITEAEKKYIETSIGERVTSRRTYKTPWKSIVRSRAVWACVCCHVMVNFFFYMVLTQGPTYLKEVMNFDITSNSFFSSLPYIAMFTLIMPVGALSDWLISRQYLRTGAVRRLMCTVGMVVPAIFLLALAHLPFSYQMAGVVLLTAAVGAFAFCFSGHLVNMADIALMHSGTLAGISNTMASFPGIIAPYVVGYVTKEGTQAEWRTAFYIAIVMNVIGVTIFLLFSSGVPQPWALPHHSRTATADILEEAQEESAPLETIATESSTQ